MNAIASPSVRNWLLERCEQTPLTPALIGDQGSCTYAQLHEEACVRAAVLARAARDAGRADGGQAPAARVALLAGNSRAYVMWLCAALEAGVQAVPLNVRLSVPELAAQLADCRPLLVLHDDAHADQAAGALRAAGLCASCRALSFDAARKLDGDASFEPPASFKLDAVADVMYTSGSTGTPKGVLQTFANHLCSARGCRENLGFSVDGDVWGCPTPLFHMSGLSIVMRSLACGVGVRLYDHFDARALNDDALAGRITCLSAVTYQIERMLDDLAGRAGAPAYPPSLRFVLQGGGPLPLDTARRAAAAGMDVVPSFGMTETASQIVALHRGEAGSKPGSSGRPLGDVQLRIARGQGTGDDPAPTGEVGRILVKSPTLAVGYLNQPQRFAEHLTEHGWFDTGDIGHVDGDGCLYVACRLADLIISGGENVYPAEVEAAVRRHPRVRDAVVVGTDDAVWGSVPVAVCTPRDACGADPLPDDGQMRAFCRPLLAAYKCPRFTVWVDSIPSTASGKPRRNLCAELAAQALARRTRDAH